MNDNPSNLGTVSLICGVLSAVCFALNCCGVPFVGILSPPLALVAIGCGGAAIQQGDSGPPAIVGALTGCLTLLVYIGLLVSVFGAIALVMLFSVFAVIAGA